MGVVQLLGGKELYDTLRLLRAGEHPTDDSICIGVDDGQFPVTGEGLRLGTAADDARAIIARDITEKSEDLRQFVSIRIHLGALAYYSKPSDNALILGADARAVQRSVDTVHSRDGLVLRGGGFVVCRSLESIQLPASVGAWLQTRTTVAMCGIDVTPVHQVIPGFRYGVLFLCMHNMSCRDIKIPAFAPLAELFFERVEGAYVGEAREYRKAAEVLGVEGGANRWEVSRTLGETLELLFSAALFALGGWLFQEIRGRAGELWQFTLYAIVAVVLLGTWRIGKGLIGRLASAIRWGRRGAK